ncbi:MAG: insulinase family protein [Ruminococcaceae bacterium]|nr:insulinase family protein [Oscillospiraceae bacterium]
MSEISYQTPGGTRIYCYKNPALHSFYISLFVRAGAVYEDENSAGIAHFLEHVSIRNVNKLYSYGLYSMLDREGIEFNATTYSDLVQFYVCGAKEKFAKGAEIISHVLSPLVLDSSEISAERRRIKAEIRESDDKSSLASFTSDIVFHDTPLAHSIIGTNKAIDKIGVKRLSEYAAEVLVSDNIFFYVTGSFTDDDISELSRLIDSHGISGGEKASNLALVPTDYFNRADEVYIKNTDITVMRFTFDVDMTACTVAESDLLYDLLLSGYNSRLFIEMSENRGIFYDISGAIERYRNIGSLYFYFELKEKDVYEAAELVVDILNSLKDERFADAECMKAAYVDNSYMLYDDVRELNFTFAYDNHVMEQGYTSVEDRKNRYADITSSRLAQLARMIFVRKNLTLTMKGSKSKTDSGRLLEILRRLG